MARSRKKAALPALSSFIDAPADLSVACACIAFGALGGWLLAGEINGVPLALVAGAAAPELLAHVCRSTPLVNLLLRGASGEAEPAAVPPAGAEDGTRPAGKRRAS